MNLIDLRRSRLEAGETPIGWKLGFGTPAGLALLGIDAPLVGFLTDRGRLAAGAEVSVEGWANPLLEPELAAWVGADGALAAIGLAIELVDLDPPADDAQSILARNVYHRHVVLGPRLQASPVGLAARIMRDGEQVAATDDALALTGPPEPLLQHVRATVGDELRPGDVVICGSIVAALPVRPGERWRYEVEPLGSLEVSFAASASSASA